MDGSDIGPLVTPGSLSPLSQMLGDLQFARQSHLAWAKHLESHAAANAPPCPACAEKPYKLDSQHEREWVAKYDRIIDALLTGGTRRQALEQELEDWKAAMKNMADREVEAKGRELLLGEKLYKSRSRSRRLPRAPEGRPVAVRRSPRIWTRRKGG